MATVTPQKAVGVLKPFTVAHQVLLKTRNQDGTWVGTPVNLAVDGDHAYFRTSSTSGNAERLRRSHDVEFAESTLNGRQLGPPVHAHAEVVHGEEEERARSLIEHEHPVLQRVIVPFWHRVRGLKTQHYRIDRARL